MSAGPDVWGPHGWKFIHFATMGFPDNASEKIKKQYINFFNLIGDVIPCPICANHYKDSLSKYKVEKFLDSKKSLINWSIIMHNEVNRIHGKKIYSFEEGYGMILDGSLPIDCSKNNYYNNANNTNNAKKRNNINNINNVNFIIIFILIIIIVCLSYHIFIKK